MARLLHNVTYISVLFIQYEVPGYFKILYYNVKI